MRRLYQVLAIVVLLANQTASPLPHTTVEAAKAEPAQAVGKNFTLTINTKNATALELADKRPNFETEVMVPLKATQDAEAKAEAGRAEAAKKSQSFTFYTVKAVVQSTGDMWEKLRLCEAGGNYARNSGNGYYGAYQYDIGTWANYRGYARADLAPPEIQDAKAREIANVRGFAPWPACASKLGLF